MKSLSVLFLLATTAALGQPNPFKTVAVPVADVWSRPIAPGEKPSDDLRETQVLFGERVLVHESSGAWVRIEAIDQPEFTHHQKWEGYPGWVDAKALSSITHEPGQQRPFHRADLIQFAEGFLGTPYLWGGMAREGGGIDCSGLVFQTYRHFAIEIPRDSHEQWMKAEPIHRADLKPADLIFSAKADNPKKITHVAMFIGWDGPQRPSGSPLPQGEGRVRDAEIIEAPQTGLTVRRISFQEKFGAPLKTVESGDRVGDRVIYFGRLLNR